MTVKMFNLSTIVFGRKEEQRECLCGIRQERADFQRVYLKPYLIERISAANVTKCYNGLYLDGGFMGTLKLCYCTCTIIHNFKESLA